MCDRNEFRVHAGFRIALSRKPLVLKIASIPTMTRDAPVSCTPTRNDSFPTNQLLKVIPMESRETARASSRHSNKSPSSGFIYSARVFAAVTTSCHFSRSRIIFFHSFTPILCSVLLEIQ